MTVRTSVVMWVDGKREVWHFWSPGPGNQCWVIKPGTQKARLAGPGSRSKNPDMQVGAYVLRD